MRERAAEIGRQALTAVLLEAAAAPKPGLVDPLSRGAHSDMDFFTFLVSAAALAPFWEKFAILGQGYQGSHPSGLLPSLRAEGWRAEKVMFSATGGVNTHKGLVFSLGLLCGAAGILSARGRPLLPEECAETAALVASGIVSRDFSRLGEKSPEVLTAGEKLYLRWGISGIRGEAEKGFPSVIRVSLPRLREGLLSGLSFNDSMIDALLLLFTVVEDTNVMSRCGPEGVAMVREEAQRVIAMGGMASAKGKEAVIAMDGLLSGRKISPGGSADLLAVTVFLHFIQAI